MKFIWLLLMSLLLSACSDRQRPSQYNKHLRKKMKVNNPVGLDFIHQQEAKHSDIPIPLNSSPIPEQFNRNEKKQGAVVMGYNTKLSLEEVALFYTLEMERFGWQQIACFDSAETLLSFEKPGHICTVSIRPSGKKSKKNRTTNLLVFTSAKQNLRV